ncbi:MAG: SHOCT domain-containing protein [Leptospiraceae bacterium]|nr:SHOCT domain-containing protein [Leptospiraceae bacterium]MCB1304672.1 SHOCT domain-containing protein [Leptospiraceae bacterium]
MSYTKLTIFTIIVGAFLAMMAAGPGAAVFPRSLLLASDLYCPEPASADVQTRDFSYGTTRGYTIQVYCTEPSGKKEEVGALTSFLSLSVLYLLPGLVGGFVLTFLALRGIAWISKSVEEQKLHRATIQNASIPGNDAAMASTVAALEAFKSESQTDAPTQHPSISNPERQRPEQSNLTARLNQLKEAYHKGLISQQEYESKRKGILEEF